MNELLSEKRDILNKLESLHITLSEDDGVVLKWDLKEDCFSASEMDIISNTPQFKALYDENPSKEFLNVKFSEMLENCMLAILVEFSNISKKH